jgi:Protein of unknown function (DUF1207)
MAPVRTACVVAAALFLLVNLPGSSGAAAPVSDDYLRGYAAAMLERELGVRAPSLEVRDGIVQISAADLGSADRDAVVAALARIEGVKQVRIVSTPTALTPTAPAPTSVHPESSSALLPGFLPSGMLFAPLLADPVWPRFSASLRYYIDENDLKDIAAVTMGETIPFFRWQGPEDHLWEVGVQALIFSLFDLTTSSADLLTTDYFGAVFLGWRSDKFSGLARLFHQSSHLGDELAKRGVTRRDLSFEGIDAKLSVDLPAGFRVYGGAGYLIRRDPESLDPWFVQLGVEFRSAWRAWQVIRPVAAIDVQSREENDWHPALSIRAGVQFDSVQVFGRSLQLLAEYYIGDPREGQFTNREVQYVGAGIYVSF